MRKLIRNTIDHHGGALAVCGSLILSAGVGAGCATAPGDEDETEAPAFSAVEQDITAVAGDPLPGILAADFAAAKAAFNTVEGLDDGRSEERRVGKEGRSRWS